MSKQLSSVIIKMTFRRWPCLFVDHQNFTFVVPEYLQALPVNTLRGIFFFALFLQNKEFL